ncbi:DMT family transporter [bacterium]|nr:DMT family transporter [bacterium]
MPGFGEMMALATAIIWAVAVILFKKSGEVVHPVGLNLFKDLLAVILLLPTLYLFGETLFYDAPAADYALLLFSGALGIGISDTLLFMCLNRLGAGLTAIVDCFYAPSIIALSIVWLGESLTFWQIIGTLMIISAIITAIEKDGAGTVKRKDLILGVIFGILAMITVAVSIVAVKPLLERSPLFWVSEIRLLGGVIMLLIILLFHPERRKISLSMISVERWGYTLSGSFVGAYVALVFWLAGMKFTQASTAAALNQTSSIFVFIFAYIFLKEPINLRRLLGIFLAVSGAFLVLFT